MDDAESDIARHARAFHDEVPHELQVSLSMSMHTRDLLREIRDELNDRAGEPVLNTNDVVQLSLVGAARYYELTEDGGHELDEGDRESVRRLMATLRDAVETDENVPFR